MNMIDENPFARRLDELAVGECAIIRDIADRDDHQRLLAMGVCEGRMVELIQSGDPLILRVFGSRIGLSGRLARGITVEICQNATCPITGALLESPAKGSVVES